MIREKIFRLHRHKSSSGGSGSTDASAHKFDFTFSNIQLLQVPRGWDKLSLSLISSESGKTVRKSGKASVRKNGTCQWTETLSESIWISNVTGSKDMEECLTKFIVAMGSSRSSILGETTLNLAAFLSSESPASVSSPLQMCNYGTILQVEVRCLTPKANLRDEKWKDVNAHKNENVDHVDMENRSEVSDSTIAKSSEPYSSNNFGDASRPRELHSRETSFSASVSRYSFDSMDDSLGRQSFSSQSDRNGAGNNVTGRQNSIESNDSASYCSYSTHGSSRSVHSLQGPFTRENQGKNQRESRKLSHASAPSLQENGSSSKMFKEAADDVTVQELEAEARMWEQNARNLAVDVETLRKELCDQNLNVTNLNIELTASRSECHRLTEEIEHLKSLLEESIAKQNAELQETTRNNIQKEFEDELRFQKEANENFSVQLQKTQESNIELLSVLQEMEETIEKQKFEMENLSANRLEFIDTDAKNSCRREDCSGVNANNQVSAESLNDFDLDSSIFEKSLRDIRENIPQENNCSLELELLNLQELHRSLQGDVLVLESTLEDKIIEKEIEQDLKNQILKECVIDCNHKVAAEEQKVMNLEAELSKALNNKTLEDSEYKGHLDASKEIECLQEKIQELETDCNELTDENLQLLFELKELRKNISKGSNTCLDSSSHDISDCITEESKLEHHVQQPVEEIKKNKILQEGLADLEDESKNLELQSERFAVHNCNLDPESQKSHEKAGEQGAEVIQLQKQLVSENGSNVFKCGATRNVDELFHSLLEQLQFFILSIKDSDILLSRMNGSKDKICIRDILESIDSYPQTAQVNAVLDKLVLSLHTILMKFVNNAQITKENTRKEVQKTAREGQNRRICVSLEEIAPDSYVEPGKNSNDEPISDFRSLNHEMFTCRSMGIEANVDSLKDKETKAPSDHKSGLELQDNTGNNERDGIMASDYLSNSISDTTLLTSSIASSCVSAENNNTDWAKHLTELEEENIYLSQRVSGLEAQLRYLTDARESSCLELQHSESQVTILQNQIRRMEEVIELQELKMKHKLLEMQKQCSEAQEECTTLSKLNIGLQATTESLVEEYNSLQKFNGVLREQKLNLQNHCMVLEAEARKLQDPHCNCAENITDHGSKYRLIIDELESKIQFSELKRLQLVEENSFLNMQLQRVPELQNEVLALRVTLKEMKTQSQLLEASFKSVSGEYEELNRERIFMVEKTSSMQKAVSEAEDCRRMKNALEEKILRLEGDLVARDALCVQDAEMRNELNQIKIANSQLLMKVKQLENVKKDLQGRVQALEEELKLTRHAEESHRQSTSEFWPPHLHPLDTNTTQQLKLSKDKEDYESRIQLLENELIKAWKANEMYRSQLESAEAAASEKSEIIDTAKCEYKISVLEAELQEIRECYLQISLKYAEVEAQREQLVLKLKALSS